jgi:hypothetical protein
MPTRIPTRNPTPQPVEISPAMKSKFASGGMCDDPNKIKITVEINTDQFGGDTGWSLARSVYSNVDIATTSNFIANGDDSEEGSSDGISLVNTRSLQGGRQIMSVATGTYGLFTYDKKEACVSPGIYNFTITDMYGDGICCAYGEGYVKIHLDDRLVMHVKSYGKTMTDFINVGYNPNPVMSDRDRLYLEAHNRRREEWFTDNGVSYQPFMYSPMLAEESRIWATKLLVNCSIADILHEPGVAEGENLAKNTGTMNAAGLGWGQLYPPNK